MSVCLAEKEFQRKKQLQESVSTLGDEYFTSDGDDDYAQIGSTPLAPVNSRTSQDITNTSIDSICEEEKVSLSKALVPMLSEVVLIAIFVAHFVVYFLCETYLHKYSWSVYLYIAMCYAQALPILFITAVIVSKREFGPGRVAKFSLLVGCIFTLILIQPIYTWATITPSVCILGFMSPFDVVMMFHVIALVFFFVFIINEHERQKEEFMSQYIKRSDVNIP